MTSHSASEHEKALAIEAASALNMCFYGAGSMAEAIAKGLLSKELTTPGRIGMFNRSNIERLEQLRKQYGVNIATSQLEKDEMLRNADIIFLAMKPKDAAEALTCLSTLIHDNQIIVSLIAGMSIHTIDSLLGRQMPVLRTMPNTSSTIGLGATGLTFSSSVTALQRAVLEELFLSIGITSVVEESLLEAVTAVSGSGPAYFYYIMESMITAGQQLGLSPQIAKELTLQTILGAAHMVKETGEEPAVLRRKVTSPNGATQAAIETLEKHGVAEAFSKAMSRCAQRAGEMGAEIERSANK